MNTHFRRLSPIPIRERASIVFLEHGRVDVENGAFTVTDKNATTQIPVGGVVCLMLEPGTRITHAAVKLAATIGCLLVWVGEGGVRLYASGQPGGASSQRLLYQASLALDETSRLKVVRGMYARRFGEPAPERRSIEQLRGMEGARVRAIYQRLAEEHGVDWKGRRYDANSWRAADAPNQAVSAATACLYGLAEAAILDDCARAGVPFFFKQWGQWAWSPDGVAYTDAATTWGREQFPIGTHFEHHSSGHTAFRVGKTRAGRRLDGREHDAFPAVVARAMEPA